MIRILSIFWILCFAFSSLIGQEGEKGDIRYFKTDSCEFTVKFFRRHSIKRKFNHGEKVAISFKESRYEGIPKIKFISPSKFIDPLWKKTAKGLDKEELKIEEDGEYTFEFNNRSLALAIPRHRRCRFEIWRGIEVLPIKSFYTYDTIPLANEKIKRDTLVINDTVLIPVLDTSIYIGATRNLLEPSREVLEFILPKDVKKWGFWIGVENEAIFQYNQWVDGLKEKNLQQPMLSYLKGIIPKLPVNRFGEEISYLFTDYKGQSIFKQTGLNSNFSSASIVKTGNDIKADFGQIGKSDTSEIPMYLCLENDAPNSRKQVHVKLMALSVIHIRDSITIDSTFIQMKSKLKLNNLTSGEIEQKLIAFQMSLKDSLESLNDQLKEGLPTPEIKANFKELSGIKALLDTLKTTNKSINSEGEVDDFGASNNENNTDSDCKTFSPKSELDIDQLFFNIANQLSPPILITDLGDKPQADSEPLDIDMNSLFFIEDSLKNLKENNSDYRYFSSSKLKEFENDISYLRDTLERAIFPSKLANDPELKAELTEIQQNPDVMKKVREFSTRLQESLVRLGETKAESLTLDELLNNYSKERDNLYTLKKEIEEINQVYSYQYFKNMLRIIDNLEAEFIKE